VRGIYAHSEGNPFFAEESYLHLAESGVLFDDQGRFRGDLRVEDLDVPSSVRMVVGERLARLSEATRRALVAAAVRGRVFEPDLVERVAGDPGGDLLDAFDEAERARLITPSRNESSSYTFTHELIRQTLLADASTVRRRRLHVAIAGALEALHADDQEGHAATSPISWPRAGRGRTGGSCATCAWPATGRWTRPPTPRPPTTSPGPSPCWNAGRAPGRRTGAPWPSWSSAWPWPCAARAAGKRRSR
jgi:hypothetical protein